MATATESEADRQFRQAYREAYSKGRIMGYCLVSGDRHHLKLRGKGEAKGLAKGEAEGEENALHQITASLFDTETADMLVEHYRAAKDPNGAEKFVEWTRECKTGDELLARARQEWGPQRGKRKGRSPSRITKSKPKNSSKRSQQAASQ